MNTNDLENALLFFSLNPNFSKDDLKKKYRELALKYHPDRGEYTSDVLFIQLMNYNSILEDYLTSKIDFDNNIVSQKISNQKKEYSLYKEAKYRESEAVLKYFNSRKNIPNVELNENRNKELLELREELEAVRNSYHEFIKNFPESIWIPDILDSLENIKVWWR